MSTYSNWREDLIEVIDTPTTEKKAEKKIKETKVNNKVVINPTFKEAVAEMGGHILEVAEVDDKKGSSEDPQIKSKEKRAGQIKRQVLMKKLQAVRAGGGADITAGYEPEGEMVESNKPEKDIDKINEKKRKNALQIQKVIGEGYKEKKTSEVLAAFKRDPKVRKRFEKAAKKEDGPGSAKNRAADDMLQTAKDTAKRKGDTSKSDDRYAYESVEVIDEGIGRAIKKAKRIGKRVLDTFDSDPGRAHTIGTLGNPHVGNEDKRAAERKAGKKKVAEGYAKPNKELPKGSKVHVKKGVKVQGKKAAPQNEGVALDAYNKIKDKEKRAKLEKELASLTKRAKAMRKHGSGYHPFLHGEEVEKVDEGIMKMVKKVIRSKKPAKKATMDDTTDKLHDWRQKNSDEQKEREKYVSPFRPIVKEADDKAYKYVVSQLKKKYGDGVLTKGDKMPEPSAAQKKKNAEIRAKRAKEDHRDPTEKASDGRYSDRYSNRGSD